MTELEKLYVQRVTRRGQWLSALKALTLLCMSLAILTLLVVKLCAFGYIPEKAAVYMLITNFRHFSASELSDILISETGSTKLFAALLVIYWGSHAFALLALVAVLIAYVMKVSEKTYRRALARILRLVEAVNAHHLKASWLTRIRLIRRVSLFRIYDSVSPLSHRWFKEPEHQWFRSSILPKQERAIVHTLSRFEDILRTISFSSADCVNLLPALSTLQEFMLSVSRRSDPFFKKRGYTGCLPLISELNLLVSFQQAVRPLVRLAAPREARAKRLFLIQWVIAVVTSRPVRYALTLSATAAIVMLFGVLFFEIGKKQAFLTWFTTTFGSLTISVGITSVLIRRRNDETG